MRGGVICFVTSSKVYSFITQAAALECGEYSFFCREDEPFEQEVKPDLIIYLPVGEAQPGRISSVLVEASKNNIPTIGYLDTNMNPTIVSYPIPGNDDHIPAIQFVARQFIDVINAGKETRKMLQETHQATEAHYATASAENDFLVKLAADLRERVNESKESAVNIGDLVKRNEYRRRALRRAKNEEEKLRNVGSKEAHLRKMTEMSEEELEAEKAARQLQTLKVAPKVAQTKKQEKKQNVTDLDSLLDD